MRNLLYVCSHAFCRAFSISNLKKYLLHVSLLLIFSSFNFQLPFAQHSTTESKNFYFLICSVSLVSQKKIIIAIFEIFNFGWDIFEFRELSDGRGILKCVNLTILKSKLASFRSVSSEKSKFLSFSLLVIVFSLLLLASTPKIQATPNLAYLKLNLISLQQKN